MKIHLIDGTYELFRNHFGAPPKKAPDGREVGVSPNNVPMVVIVATKSRRMAKPCRARLDFDLMMTK